MTMTKRFRLIVHVVILIMCAIVDNFVHYVSSPPSSKLKTKPSTVTHVPAIENVSSVPTSIIARASAPPHKVGTDHEVDHADVEKKIQEGFEKICKLDEILAQKIAVEKQVCCKQSQNTNMGTHPS